jgi:outer membrane lipoprotein-sorting protein
MRKPIVGVLLCSLLTLVLLAAPPSAQSSSWTLDGALKQVDKALKGVKGVAADAQVTEVTSGEEGEAYAGKVHVSKDGKMRIDLEGEGAGTLLRMPEALYVHRPADGIVEHYKLARHPGKLAQYAILGFAIAGKDLRKDFLLTLIEESSLEGRKVLLLELTPQSEAMRGAVSKIHLWIDQANWMPAQQRMYHSAADTHLTILYTNVARNDALDPALFRPKWPKGTKTVRK